MVCCLFTFNLGLLFNRISIIAWFQLSSWGSIEALESRVLFEEKWDFVSRLLFCLDLFQICTLGRIYLMFRNIRILFLKFRLKAHECFVGSLVESSLRIQYWLHFWSLFLFILKKLCNCEVQQMPNVFSQNDYNNEKGHYNNNRNNNCYFSFPI